MIKLGYSNISESINNELNEARSKFKDKEAFKETSEGVYRLVATRRSKWYFVLYFASKDNKGSYDLLGEFASLSELNKKYPELSDISKDILNAINKDN